MKAKGNLHSLLPLALILLELGKQVEKKKHLQLCLSMLWHFGTPGLSSFTVGRVAEALKVWEAGVTWEVLREA